MPYENAKDRSEGKQFEYKKEGPRNITIFLLKMASLIHHSSAELTTSQLDLFSVPPSQTSLNEGSLTEYRPVSILISKGPIKFAISAKNFNYIHLANTFLCVRASVTVADGANLVADAEIAPECNFLLTL